MVDSGRSGRRRAITVLTFVIAVAIALGAGLMYAIMSTLHRSGGSPSAMTSPAASAGNASGSPAASAGSLSAQQDALAAEPMLQLPQSAAQPQALTTATAGPPIVVPAATSTVVPGGPPVATGFPHTPEGALGQLTAIDEKALSTTDLARVHEVYAWAAVPGAVAEQQWTPYHGITTLIDHLGGTSEALQAQARFQVVQGQVKGTVGADFVVACVLGELDVTAASVARAGVGDCQRMVWVNNRWQIGAGAQPAWAPSAWPGSADAVRGGWRDLKRA